MFAMQNRPMAVQLTLHINNLICTYDRKEVITTFKRRLNKLPYSVDRKINTRMESLLSYYGEDYIKNWFKEIYGWSFEGAA